MKILIVGQCFVSEINGKISIPGGTERYVYGLAKQLQIDKHEVVVLSTTQNKNETGWRKIDNINTYKMHISSKLYLLTADFFLFLNTIKIIRHFNPAIVHTISPFYKFSAGAIVAAKLFGKKTVYTRTTAPQDQGRHFVASFVDKFIFTNVLKHADITIVLSEQMKKLMEQKFLNIEIIPSFITNKYFNNTKKIPMSILYVGRLDKFKGVDVLIKSMLYIKEKLPRIILHIVGSGECLNSFINLSQSYNLEENIIFEGHLSDFELVNMYSQSDIFVFPSYREGMPMSLIEAMSSGLPIIASDIEPCVELLENGKYGILVKKGDPKDLADGICKLITDDILKKQYSNLCMEKSKQYTQEIIVKRIEHLYDDLIRNV